MSCLVSFTGFFYFQQSHEGYPVVPQSLGGGKFQVLAQMTEVNPVFVLVAPVVGVLLLEPDDLFLRCALFFGSHAPIVVRRGQNE